VPLEIPPAGKRPPAAVRTVQRDLAGVLELVGPQSGDGVQLLSAHGAPELGTGSGGGPVTFVSGGQHLNDGRLPAVDVGDEMSSQLPRSSEAFRAEGALVLRFRVEPRVPVQIRGAVEQFPADGTPMLVRKAVPSAR